MSDQVYHSPQSVAKALSISPASLRRWSDEFTDYLAKGAGSTKDRSHRRYNDSDIEILMEIKELMNSGMTYEQVRQHLRNQSIVSVEPDDISDSQQQDTSNGRYMSNSNLLDDDLDDEEQTDEADSLAMVAADDGSESPAIAFLNNTLSTLSDTQKSILNSQTANRELLGVLLQDNFNLKEENNRLRERILEVERQLAQSRQEEEWRREALRQELEVKIGAANQLAAEAMTAASSIEMPEIKAVETKPGCMGMLFGRGGTQIITTQRRKSGSQGTAPQSSSVGSQYSGIQPTQQPDGQSHPKPVFPPE